MLRSKKLTKRLCDTAQPMVGPNGEARERVLWDTGDGAVKGFGLRVSAKGARSFILMYRAGKGRSAPLRKVTIGPFGSHWTVETGRAEAKRILGEVAAGRDPSKAARRQAGADPDRTNSVAAAIDEWLKRDQAENRSIVEVRRIIQREILPLWGSRPLGSIRKRDVIDMIDGIADRGAKIMANRTLAQVRRFFNWAAGRDLIEVNPAQFVEKPAPEIRRDRVLDDGELVEVWRAVDGMAQPFAAGVRLLILTAARRSEIFEVSRAELVPGGIQLPAERSKTDEGRIIHLSAPALEIVEALPVFANSPWVLTVDGRHPFSNFSYARIELERRILATRMKSGGVDAKPIAPWRLHDLRRSVATGLQRHGVRLETIEAVLGHLSGSRSGIVGVYQRHAFEKEAAEALELWGDHMMRLLDPEPAKVLPMRKVER